MHFLSVASSLAVAVITLLTSTKAISLPECQAVAPNQTILNSVQTTYIDVPAPPFGLAYGPHGRHAFVTLQTSLGVLDTTKFIPHLTHQIALPPAYVSDEGANGIIVTHDGRHILVAAGPGAVIINVARAIKGRPDAVVGTLNSTTPITGNAALEVTITHDDEYVIVTQEYGSVQTSHRGNLEVFKLNKPTANNGSVSGTYVGNLILGYAVGGTAFSPDGQILYATSQTTTINDTTLGTLSVIDVATLKTDPSKALISSVPAGCGPVRVIASSNGKTVWLAARESNHLLAFNATKLRANTSTSDAGLLVAYVQVGTAPVGLTFAQNESRIIVSSSNRFNYPNTTSGLSVVDVDAALRGQEALIGNIPTGLFPRDLAFSPDNATILVADYYSLKVQAVNVTTIP